MSFIVFMMLGPSVGYACKCIEKPSVEKELKSSRAVFSGKVIEIKEGKQAGIVVEKVLFEVDQTWKGSVNSQVNLATEHNSCSFQFREGENYIVYAKPSPKFKDESLLTTGVCDRTALVGQANEDLSILGTGTAPAKAVNLEDEINNSGLSLYIWIPVLGVVAGFGYWTWKRKV
ncbi:hypothetical protein [Neobacillus notoginsengisoli]|uniref:hypothetical protein n=1 Tax=Neobacillus notoginsengisoli TaxID=1578198 RepID=UPI0019563595|nr:hypothetical protein [Neobacillus notoginsengisoli]